MPVVACLNDPVATGLVGSLAKPGGAVTGLSVEIEHTALKQFELLQRLMPRLGKVELLVDAVTDTTEKRTAPVARAARALGIATQTHRIDGLPGFERVLVENGLLMAYFVNEAEVGRRLAALLDKVLGGAKPADIPFEKPTRFDFVINRKTAREIGLEIPAEVLLRADEVIG